MRNFKSITKNKNIMVRRLISPSVISTMNKTSIGSILYPRQIWQERFVEGLEQYAALTTTFKQIKIDPT